MESALVPVGNGSPIFVLPKAREMLEKAGTVQDIRKVESFADLARKYAKAAKMGREAVNQAARLTLDARRKLGATLVAMQARGELAGPGRPKLSHRATFNLGNLGLTRDQASRYRLEASVPEEIYQEWCRRTIRREDGFLAATDLRRLARELCKSDADRPASPDSILAKKQIRGYVVKISRKMGPRRGQCVPYILIDISNELLGLEKCCCAPVVAKKRRPSKGTWCYDI